MKWIFLSLKAHFINYPFDEPLNKYPKFGEYFKAVMVSVCLWTRSKFELFETFDISSLPPHSPPNATN